MPWALFVFLLCESCWLGGMIFFAAIVAPTVFSRLPLPEAGKVISGIFPRYYLLGYCAGAIALVLAIYFLVIWPNRLWWTIVVATLASALALTLYGGLVLRPQIDSLRPVVEQPNPDAERKARFDKLHRLSVEVNGVVIVMNLISLAATAGALAKHVS